MVGYNVQAAVETTPHLIVAHDVINEGNDRSQLSAMSKKAKAARGTKALEVVADLPVETVRVDYPPAHIFRPVFADDSVSVYTDTAIVKATLRLGVAADPVSSHRLSLTLLFQACNDVQCLASTKVTLPVNPAGADGFFW